MGEYSAMQQDIRDLVKLKEAVEAALVQFRRDQGQPYEWMLPREPDLGIKAVRDRDGDLWIHLGVDRWQIPGRGWTHNWYHLFQFGPLTDATGEV